MTDKTIPLTKADDSNLKSTATASPGDMVLPEHVVALHAERAQANSSLRDDAYSQSSNKPGNAGGSTRIDSQPAASDRSSSPEVIAPSEKSVSITSESPGKSESKLTQFSKIDSPDTDQVAQHTDSYSPTRQDPDVTQFTGMIVEHTPVVKAAQTESIPVPSLQDLPSSASPDFGSAHSAQNGEGSHTLNLPSLEIGETVQSKSLVQNPFQMTEFPQSISAPQNSRENVMQLPIAHPDPPNHSDRFIVPNDPSSGLIPRSPKDLAHLSRAVEISPSLEQRAHAQEGPKYVPSPEATLGREQSASSQDRSSPAVLTGRVDKSDYQPSISNNSNIVHGAAVNSATSQQLVSSNSSEQLDHPKFNVVDHPFEHSRDLSSRKESISGVRGGSDLVKSHRSESFSTDKSDASGKTVKPSDSSKIPSDTHTDASARTKREPLIIPGVITSRITDKVKNEPVTTKGDKSDELAPGKKVPGSTSEIISGVAGKIADSLSTIKDKFNPGQKTQPESTQIGGAKTPRPDLVNHAEQPKPRDFIVPTPIDINQSNRGPVTEFVVNGKLPVTKAINGNESETLVNKAGGLKQALHHIFGEHPTLAADLKFVTFPGPKTLPVETKNIQNTIKVLETKTESDKHSTDLAIKTSADAEYLRNQKGDKIQTLSLKEQLAQLKAMEHLDSHAHTDDQSAPIDSAKQIKQFTTQLGDITRDKEPVDLPEHTVNLNPQFATSEEDTDSRYLYLVKTGDTLRSIFIEQLPHLAANAALFEFFVQINEQTVRLHSDISSDGMSLLLRAGTTIKLPTPKQISSLSAT